MITLDERISKYMDRVEPAVSGQKGHTSALLAARCLVWDWGLSESDALPYFKAYNERCSPPWSEAELKRKLNQAYNYPQHETERGHLVGEGYLTGDDKPILRAPEPKPVFEPEKLARLAAELNEDVGVSYLEARSKFSCWNRSPAGALHKLYQPGEKVLIFTEEKSQGAGVWEHKGISSDLSALDQFKSGWEKGIWFLCQPVTGEFVELERLRSVNNPKGRSRRCEECVTSWRYILFESDQASPRLWIKALVQWPLPIAAIYLSGRRSIHALVRIDASSKKEWDAVVKKHLASKLVPFGACPGALTGVRLTRLPGCMREETGKMQQLLYLDGDPDGTAICEKEVLREGKKRC
jgi:hypothetical protein